MSKFSSTLKDLIKNALFHCEYDVKLFFTLLEAFRLGFYASIAVEHVQNAVLSVECLVFGRQVFVHMLVRQVEVVDIRLVDGRSGQFHFFSCAERFHVETLFPFIETQVDSIRLEKYPMNHSSAITGKYCAPPSTGSDYSSRLRRTLKEVDNPSAKVPF